MATCGAHRAARRTPQVRRSMSVLPRCAPFASGALPRRTPSNRGSASAGTARPRRWRRCRGRRRARAALPRRVVSLLVVVKTARRGSRHRAVSVAAAAPLRSSSDNRQMLLDRMPTSRSSSRARRERSITVIHASKSRCAHRACRQSTSISACSSCSSPCPPSACSAWRRTTIGQTWPRAASSSTSRRLAAVRPSSRRARRMPRQTPCQRRSPSISWIG
mmetsp:Transcript_5497/g.22782  ORF Transcript_5497/g.22782 Transcript_5497/m.22782 type:complete len:219 (-) Transcript_5497:896-1552(-)